MCGVVSPHLHGLMSLFQYFLSLLLLYSRLVDSARRNLKKYTNNTKQNKKKHLSYPLKKENVLVNVLGLSKLFQVSKEGIPSIDKVLQVYFSK